MNNLKIFIYKNRCSFDSVIFSSIWDNYGDVTLDRCSSLSNFLFPSNSEISIVFSYVLYSMLRTLYNMSLNIDRFDHYQVLDHKFVSHSQGDTYYLHIEAEI